MRKPIFDAVRSQMGTIKAEWVPVIDKALDDIGFPKDGGGVLKTSQAGINLIHSFESYAEKLPDGSVKAYPDPATGGKPFTIGWGSTTDEVGKPIQPGTIWTRDRADKRFLRDLERFENGVLLAVGSATQNQFDAMVSLAYNIGVAAFTGSTLVKKHKAGDYAGAKAQFAVWNKGGGKVMAGLVRRRAAEAELYGK